MAYTDIYVTDAGAGAGDGSTLADAMSWANMLTDATAGSVRYLVSGNVSRGANTDTFTTNGSAANPRSIQGIISTAGDLEANGVTRGAGPVTTNFPVITYTTGRLTLPALSVTEMLSVTSAATAATLTAGTNSVIRRCTVTNTHASSATAIGLTGSSSTRVSECSISVASSNSGARALASAGGVFNRTLFTGNTAGSGCVTITGAAQLIDCMFRDAGFGISTNSVTTIIGCSFRNITNTCIDNTSAFVRVVNCVAWGTNSTDKFYNSTTSVRQCELENNAYGNFATALTNVGDWSNVSPITLTVDPFTSSTVLTLNTTAGGGALCISAGLPRYRDVGAWQSYPVQGPMIGGF